MIDENLLGLEDELGSMNYTTKTLKQGLSDEQIKDHLRDLVFITRNGHHFNDSEDLVKYHYGLVWVVSKTKDPLMLARKIKNEVLMKSNFHKHLLQIVKV